MEPNSKVPMLRDQLNAFGSDIGDRLAARAHQVMMFSLIHLKTLRAVMQTYLAQDPIFNENVDVVVHRCQ